MPVLKIKQILLTIQIKVNFFTIFFNATYARVYAVLNVKYLEMWLCFLSRFVTFVIVLLENLVTLYESLNELWKLVKIVVEGFPQLLILFFQAKVAEIKLFAASRVEELRGGLKIVEKIPRNSMGKIMRHVMKKGQI